MNIDVAEFYVKFWEFLPTAILHIYFYYPDFY